MFPVFLALVPLFFLVQDLHMTATYQGLILVYIAYSLPFTIFFLTGFFRTLPTEVAEAALVDGASHFRIFFNIMLPMATPGLIAMGIFNFLGPVEPVPAAAGADAGREQVRVFAGAGLPGHPAGLSNDYSALFAAMTITMIPTLVVYVLFQRRLESGLTAGALKG